MLYYTGASHTGRVCYLQKPSPQILPPTASMVDGALPSSTILTNTMVDFFDKSALSANILMPSRALSFGFLNSVVRLNTGTMIARREFRNDRYCLVDLIARRDVRSSLFL